MCPVFFAQVYSGAWHRAQQEGHDKDGCKRAASDARKKLLGWAVHGNCVQIVASIIMIIVISISCFSKNCSKVDH